MKSIGLYIHIPYCLHKCGYCDFNSHAVDPAEMERFVPALLSEIDHGATRIGEEREVATVFIGGGTPTTLPPQALETLLSHLRQRFRLAGDAEITLETNPATLAPGLFERLREAGVNRLSVGIQSFDAGELKLLERVHSVAEAHETVKAAQAAGFYNLSMDLMFALPGQTARRFRKHLETALALRPEHLSTYNLTIEKNTAFYNMHRRGQLAMAAEEEQLAQYQETLGVMAGAGYEHYEISNFCRPGRECRHNLIYWNNGEHLGLGPGASSYLGGVRSRNCKLPARYIREVNATGRAIEFEETLKPREAMGETLMLGLRLLKGIAIDAFEARFKTSFREVYGKTLDGLLDQNLIQLDDNRIALSPKGLFLADSVILEFIT
ncbi:MAG: radical SAM family heme chaperone HemW [Nitrospinaceae bacterium]|nr:MAG: radical SAM family heme chaperone HemW [Nitrospinaceae bacterium]